MNQGEDAEISQKLADLKTYQEQFDQARHTMRHARNQDEIQAQWYLMEEAEKRYNTLSDWFTARRYTITWNREKQAYEARK
jgi:hypothetical protein